MKILKGYNILNGLRDFVNSETSNQYKLPTYYLIWGKYK